MTTLFRTTAQSATMLLGACTLIWAVGGVAQGRPITFETIGVLWLVGWPVLFVGFSVRDLVDRSHAN